MTRKDRSPGLEALLVAAFFVVLAIGFLVYGARGWAPELASRHGAGIDSMMTFLLAATGAMFVAGHLALAWFVWSNAGRSTVANRSAKPRTERRIALGLGLLMTFVAEGGVIVIGLPVFQEYFGEIPDDAVVVAVTGQQFAWNAHYPGHDATFGRADPGLITPNNPLGLDRADPAAADDTVAINQIRLPVNRPAHVILRSRDVIHSFYLPHFRVKQDAVPGMTIDVWFTPTREGRFEIPCAELCGLGHYRMKGFLEVVSEEAFAAYLAGERAPSPNAD